MATYEFLCRSDGLISVRLPIGQAPESLSCPGCHEPARRRFSIPQLRIGDSRARRVIAATEDTASEPAVVAAPHGRRLSPTRRPSADPRTAMLPSP